MYTVLHQYSIVYYTNVLYVLQDSAVQMECLRSREERKPDHLFKNRDSSVSVSQSENSGLITSPTRMYPSSIQDGQGHILAFFKLAAIPANISIIV